ncbi:hypothetical protein AN477_08625 [Alicyclobacillus ferrooxydans]|uniref:MurNAc-LAA domain-containing protein n=1 Tax=Alicyclobacillus ferrooxydans TaxID=471514 RepID=A0A0P9GSW8_9BACL|nr:hypothetical protein AN477_08625 [Alicyclobacillus ferrooxydans]
MVSAWLSIMTVVALLVWMPAKQAYAEDGAPESGLLGRTIVLDPGHGAPDSGARSDSGILEKDITLSVALKLSQLLQQAGANVVLTRTTDDDLASEHDRHAGRRQSTDLRNRVLTAKAKHADAFISIHCNAVPSERWTGAQTLYQRGNPAGEKLAKVVQERFRELLLPTAREPAATSTLFLLKRIPGPAVIAEIGFLSNRQESVQLASQAYQRTVAFSIYLALYDYFSQQSSVPVPDSNVTFRDLREG